MSDKLKCLHSVLREYGENGAWICTECDVYFPPEFKKANEVRLRHLELFKKSAISDEMKKAVARLSKK